MTPFLMIGARIRRRQMLQVGIATLAGPSVARGQAADLPALIRRTASPLALEAPIDSFNTPITAVERFFVCYNLPIIPTAADLQNWSLKIGGDGAERSVTLSLDDLRALPMREMVAVCQCAGNRRAMAMPPAPGVQWGDGAMGCARWRGVRLRDVLLKAGVKSDTVEVAMLGADSGRNPDLSPYAKSLPLERAMDAGTLIALEMNGAPLPLLHGFPARIIRPGWAGTYWVKHLTQDGGSGVQSVEVSLDGGTHWKTALLGPDAGRFAFRLWRFPVLGIRPGALKLVVRATGNNGQVQGERTRANPGGFFLNTTQKLNLVTTA